MADKKQILLESVRKLLELKIGDREIIDNLKDVGISEKQARQLIAEAKGKKVRKEEIEEPPLKTEAPGKPGKPGTVFRKVEEELGGEEETAPEIEEPVFGKEPEAAAPKPEAEAAERKPAVVPEAPEPTEKEFRVEPAKKPLVTTLSTGQISKLWEKGILATVDSKLSEMQAIRDGLEKVLDEKIKKQLEKEVKKIEVTLEAQRELMVSKVNAALENKAKEITDVIDLRLTEIRAMNELTQKNLDKMEAQKKFNTELLNTIDGKLAELNKTKSVLISEMNSAIIQAQSKVEEFIRESAARVKETDARINSSLDLSSKIAEGMLKDAQARVDKMSLAKADELSLEVEARLREIDAIRKKVQPEKISSELDRLEHTMKDLEAFKQQFIKTIDRNVDSFNKAKKEIAASIKKREALIDKHIASIDAKMEELQDFEALFSKEMGLAVKKKRSKKRSK